MTIRLVPLKHLVGINERSLGEDTDPGYTFRYVDIGAVGHGALVAEPQEMTFEKAPSRARRIVRPGDTIVSTVRTYLRAVWPVPDPADDLVVSTGFAVLTPHNVDPRYFSWWARSDPFIEEIVARSVGVSYPAINPLQLGELKVRVPSAREQRAIADYLDAETARIDALIAKKRRLIDLLEERFWQAATRRIELVSYRRAPLRRVIMTVSDGPFGSSLTSSHYASEGARVVRLGNIGFAEFKNEDKAYIPIEHFDTLLRHRVLPGDLLIAGLGDSRHHVGRACVAPDLGRAIVKADCYCARVDHRRADPRFLALFLSSPIGAAEVAVAARGTTRARINLDIAKEIAVPVPPVEEQRKIVAEVEAERRRTYSLSGRLERQLALLQEHRLALITAAVTGELDVPEVAA